MNWLRLLRRRRSGRRPSDKPPATLALILPDDLTEHELANGIHQALDQSRDAFADQARYTAALAGEEKGDEVRRAYLTGRSHAFNEAVARTDAAVADMFGATNQHPSVR